jgi:uncharacterized protein YukE
MPAPTDAPDQPDQAEPRPAPITAYQQTFDLGADPAALEAAAESVRGLGSEAVSARDTLDTAAGQVEAEGSWQGETADAFQGRRRRLGGDLGLVGDAASGAAETLEYVAAILRFGQAQLDEQRARLSAITSTEQAETSMHPSVPEGPRLVFEPGDEAEAALVSDAVRAAGEIRTRVDEQLETQAAAFRRILTGATVPDPLVGNDPGLAAISDTWRPRSVRVLDLNVGQGYGNVPWGWPLGDEEAGDGTDPGDIDEIGRIIANSDANVITLQEMFEGNAADLQNWLNENTDGEWRLHFENAQHKMQHDDSPNPWRNESGMHDFGNAVLVREGGGLGTPIEREPTELQEPGWGDYVDMTGHRNPHGPPTVGVDLGGHPEGRVLQHTEVPVDE